MRIAILGGGFAGLAVAWYILHYTQGGCAIDLFDPEPISGGASGLSSGLLHAYGGKQARQSWEAERCLRETHRLITVASHAIAQPIVLSKGILRPALSEQQIANFQTCAKNHPDTEWWDQKTCETQVEGLQVPPSGGGLYLKEGFTLNVKNYLMGLWQACAFHGVQYHQQARIDEETLSDYDRVLIAMGPMSVNFPPLRNLPITAVKGQIIEMKWPDTVKPLPFSLNSQKHIVMRPDYKSCLVGSTYEHHFTSPKPDRAFALQQIMPNIAAFFPPLANGEIINVYSSFRASSSHHLPLAGKISDKYYFFTGLGSKGLLYHAWIGKRVARTLLTGNLKHLPPEIFYKLDAP